MGDFPYIDADASISANKAAPGLPSNFIATAFLTGVLVVAPGSMASSQTRQTPAIARAGSISTSGQAATYIQVDRVDATAAVPDVATRVLETRDSVRELRQRSGLTWDELARLFGVSRRTAHAWANGSRLNQAHAERLTRIVRAMDAFVADSPETTRSRLLAPDEGGVSAFQRLIQELRTGEPAEGFRPEELLGIERVSVD